MGSYCTLGVRSSSLTDTENNIDDPELQTKETASSSNALPSDVSVFTRSSSGSTTSSVSGNFMNSLLWNGHLIKYLVFQVSIYL